MYTNRTSLRDFIKHKIDMRNGGENTHFILNSLKHFWKLEEWGGFWGTRQKMKYFTHYTDSVQQYVL